MGLSDVFCDSRGFSRYRLSGGEFIDDGGDSDGSGTLYPAITDTGLPDFTTAVLSVVAEGAVSTERTTTSSARAAGIGQVNAEIATRLLPQLRTRNLGLAPEQER